MEPYMISKSEQETIDVAIQLAKSLPTRTVLLLEGELGAGKTCFVRGLCEGLGGDPSQVNSPTFVIMQEYEIAQRRRLVHVDAYRLAGEEELETIGWDELLKDTHAIIAIEWPSRIKNAIPEGAISILIDHIDIDSREIIIE